MSSFFAMIASFFRRIVAFFKREPVTELPTPDGPGPGEVVCYYGCPNSKKARKLQLDKKPL